MKFIAPQGSPNAIAASEKLAWNPAKQYRCHCCRDTGFVVVPFSPEGLETEESGILSLDGYDQITSYPIYCAATHCNGRKGEIAGVENWHRPQGGLDYQQFDGFRQSCDRLHKFRYESAVATAKANHERRQAGQNPEVEDYQKLAKQLASIGQSVAAIASEVEEW
jgi:hypothetical protein